MEENILVLEDQNNEGLSVYMDGFPANGRGVYVSQGETITKIIKVKQTDQSRLDYEGVKIRFVSQYQPAIIFDEVTLNIDCWMLWKHAGTLLQLGTGQFVLGIDEEGHVVTSIAGSEVKSRDVLPKDKWTYLVLSYKAADKVFSALAQYDTQTLTLFSNQPVAENASVWASTSSTDGRWSSSKPLPS